jgi:hypothetical protein
MSEDKADVMPDELWCTKSTDTEWGRWWASNHTMTWGTRYIRADLYADQARELDARMTDYLGNGGYFNPEMMDHDKVSRLILDARNFLRSIAETKP